MPGFLHQGKNSRKTMFLTTAECQGACDADYKCQSFSYSTKKHDCITSETAIRFNPEFKYYSRQPWMHKSHIDDDDGTNFGSVFGRYSVFTGMMYPERTKFAERKFISLGKCKDLCDADPPKSIETNQRLGKMDPEVEYVKGDGCVAFSYSHKSQTCLLKGVPISYNPSYVYYAKKAVEGSATEFSKLGPEGRKKEAKLAHSIEEQEKAADADQKQSEQAAQKQSVKNNEKQAQQLEQEQAAVKAAARKEAKQELKAAAAEAKAAENTKPKADKKADAERKVKESTEKELAKETMLEAQAARDSENASKEAVGKKRAVQNQEAAGKLQARSAEEFRMAKERDLKGNLKPMLIEMIDKAQLMANNERDLKAAIARGKETNTKEIIVKHKVRESRLERREKGIVYDHENAMAKEASAAVNAQKDAAVVAAQEKKVEETKATIQAEQKKLDILKKQQEDTASKVDTLKSQIAETKAAIEKAGPHSGALQAELQEQESSLATAESEFQTAESDVSAQDAEVTKAEDSLAALTGELSKAKAAENLANAKADIASNNVKYEYTGNKPRSPTNEESMLYRKFSKMFGLPVPGDASNPVPANPEVTDEPDEEPAKISSGVPEALYDL